MNEQCPYCRQRAIAMTLCTPEGIYHVCRPCAVQWGLAAKASVAGLEVNTLEHWYSLPDAQVAR